MHVIKKYVFLPLAVLALAGFIFFYLPFVNNPMLMFSFGYDILQQTILAVVMILLFSMLFSIYTMLANEPKFAVPGLILLGIVPFLLLEPISAVIAATGLFIVMAFTYFGLRRAMQTYVTFNPTAILLPLISSLSTLTLIVFTIPYYLSAQTFIQKKGIVIPEQILDVAISAATQNKDQTLVVDSQVDQPQLGTLPTLTKEQIETLKTRPDVLAQFGLSEKDLDMVMQTQTKQSQAGASPQEIQQYSTNEIVKASLKKQMDNMLQPYKPMIPLVLALLFYVSLQTLASLGKILLNPLIWALFIILEKTKFITFTTETREVKKLVV